MKQIIYNKGILEFRLDQSHYSEGVVYKCFYWYLSKFHVSILSDPNNYIVRISSTKKDEFDEEELIVRIKNDLIDFKLREIVNQETHNIRELITAKAFAQYDFNINEENSFPISDPVGFDPKDIE